MSSYEPVYTGKRRRTGYAIRQSKVGIAGRKAANSLLPCKSCQVRNRRGVGAYCVRCERNRTRYGDPKGRAIPRAFYRAEARTITRFVWHFKSHPGIKAAINFFDVWMKQAAEGREVPGQRVMANLFEHGVEGKVVLKEVLSVWLYLHRFPHTTPNVAFAICNAVRRCCASERTGEYRDAHGNIHRSYHVPNYHTRDAIGQTIIKTLSPLMGRFMEYLKEREKLENEQKAKLGTPFSAQEAALSRRQDVLPTSAQEAATRRQERR